MNVIINGAPSTLQEGTTVSALLADLSLPADGVAVAINLHVVPRGQHAERVIVEGEKIEIIRAVGGG